MALLPIGTIVGSFVIESFIGRGQFALTYKARHRALDYPVALKEFFPRDLCGRNPDGTIVVLDPTEQQTYAEERDIFFRESQALTPFRHHPNIVTVLDNIECKNTNYIVMEFIDGHSLLQAIVDPATSSITLASEGFTRSVLSGVLSALEALHGSTPPLLHRDIKPANIMIEKKTGTPVLIDFGASRQIIAGRTQRLTTILTRGYAPYEQYALSEGELEQEFDGAVPDALRRLPKQGPYSDLYSLGATCHFMLSGRVPPDALLRKAGMESYVPLAEAAAGGVSASLFESIDRSLALEPQDRFQSAAEWKESLLAKPEDASTVKSARALEMLPQAPAVPKSPPPRQPEVPSAVPAGPKPPRTEGHSWLWIPFAFAALALAFAYFLTLGGTGQSQPHSGPDSPPEPHVADCIDCPSMIAIPAGSFHMGSPKSEAGHHPNEEPLHPVTLKAFSISEHEITVGQWQACIGQGGCSAEPMRYIKDLVISNPVTYVNWHQAQSYAAWLSRKTGKAFRLPTEAEWEYAARADPGGTSRSPYPWGTSTVNVPANCGECSSTSAAPALKPVGSYLPNHFGLYDMSGNAWEWVEDCASDDLSRVPTDGTPFIEADCRERIIKGGGYANKVTALRSASRFAVAPDNGAGAIGFRVARND